MSYTVPDLFITNWQQLPPKVHLRVYLQYLILKSLPKDSAQYGQLMITILRKLRRSWLVGFKFRRLLIDRINKAQAVDVFNEVEQTLLSKPWFFFPELDSSLVTPDAELARTTFDQFIYADNEFTKFTLATQAGDDATLNILLARLAATLYSNGNTFDPEDVEAQALRLKKVNNDKLQLVAFTFDHVRTKMITRCKHLMQRGSSDATPQPSGSMWDQIKHHLARSGAFGSYNEVGKSRVYAVLDHLNQLALEAKQKPTA